MARIIGESKAMRELEAWRAESAKKMEGLSIAERVRKHNEAGERVLKEWELTDLPRVEKNRSGE